MKEIAINGHRLKFKDELNATNPQTHCLHCNRLFTKNYLGTVFVDSRHEGERNPEWNNEIPNCAPITPEKEKGVHDEIANNLGGKWPKRPWISPPWRLTAETEGADKIIFSSDDELIFSLWGNPSGPTNLQQANATMRFLCAAPLLFEAAKKVVDTMESATSTENHRMAAIGALKLMMAVCEGKPNS